MKTFRVKNLMDKLKKLDPNALIFIAVHEKSLIELSIDVDFKDYSSVDIKSIKPKDNRVLLNFEKITVHSM